MSCHTPKIEVFPEGEWHCMECQPCFQPNFDGESGGEDENDDLCDVCGDYGDLICCDHCNKSYHLDCHSPKIDTLPKGKWHCMDCRPLFHTPNKVGRPKKLFIAEVSGKEWKCKIRGPIETCSICFPNDGDQDLTHCKTCDKPYHLKCHTPSLDSKPRGRWKCSKCKDETRILADSLMKKSPSVKNEHDNDNISPSTQPRNVCTVCCSEGDQDTMTSCKNCDKFYHLRCHKPALNSKPRGRWKCSTCKDEALALSNKPRKTCTVCLCEGDQACTLKDTMTFCKTCMKYYHLKCHSPSLKSKPRGRWKCSECHNKGKISLDA